MTRLEEARERCMDALDGWWEIKRRDLSLEPFEADLIEAYAALKRAQNGEPEDE
jgi:hypothetical protein